jgi:hypothetical protein
MKSVRKAAARNCALAVAAGALWLANCAVAAQPSSDPPPLPSKAAPEAAPARPVAPSAEIRLTPAERQAIDAARAGKSGAVRAEDSLAPTAEDMKPRSDDDATGRTRIEQLHQSNRVSEVIVTPAGQSRGYVMTNREGRQPYGAIETNPGLSVPMFLQFEFGKPAPTTPNTPPPPSPPPSR